MINTFSFEVPESELQDVIEDLEKQGLKRSTKQIGVQIDKGEYCISKSPSEIHPGQQKVNDQGHPLWSVEALKK